MDATVVALIKSSSSKYGMDWRLVYGICRTESHFKPFACRYEPMWNEKWLVSPDIFAKALGQTVQTEIIQQKCSWGIAQTMGAVARELEFTGYLPELCQPEISLKYGCLKLQSLMRKYQNLDDVIVSYNSGSPRRQSDGRYTNEGYLLKVRAAIAEISAQAQT